MALQRLDLPVLEQGIVAQTQAWAVLLRQLAVAEVELLLTPAQDFLVALEVVALNTLEGHLSWYDMSLSEFYHPSYVRREQLLADEHAAEEP